LLSQLRHHAKRSPSAWMSRSSVDVVSLKNMVFVLWPLISFVRFSEIPARIMLRTAVRRKS